MSSAQRESNGAPAPDCPAIRRFFSACLKPIVSVKYLYHMEQLVEEATANFVFSRNIPRMRALPKSNNSAHRQAIGPRHTPKGHSLPNSYKARASDIDCLKPSRETVGQLYANAIFGRMTTQWKPGAIELTKVLERLTFGCDVQQSPA